MRHFTTTLLLLYTLIGFSQEKKTVYKEYSFTQLFKMIEEEKDTIFKLKNAFIRYNAKTDSLRTTIISGFLEVKPLQENQEKIIIIDKRIVFKNVMFNTKFTSIKDSISDNMIFYDSGVLTNIHFKKRVIFEKVIGLTLHLNVFDEGCFFFNQNKQNIDREFLTKNKIGLRISIGENIFKKGVNLISIHEEDEKQKPFFHFFRNTIHTQYEEKAKTNFNASISFTNSKFLIISFNQFTGNGFKRFEFSKNQDLSLTDNTFTGSRTEISITGEHDALVFKKNSFAEELQLSLNNLRSSDLIDWKQFNNSIISYNAFDNYTKLLPDKEYDLIRTDSFTTLYKEKLRFLNPEIYGGESAIRGVLYKHYRDNFDMVSANNVYMNLKDFETKHLKFMYEVNPSFDTYFQWKVNQFLKVFSDYGTKPSKAITFSVYVIFVFALFYLFFPNSWDRHGKNRILDRYSFFLKYMDKKAGIHEVYLEGQKEEILAYDEYKKLIEKSDKRVPKFFTATVLPIYKWSVASTQLSTSFLRKIDVMKGTWSDLPKSKRIWKSILLISVFLIAVCYDVFIKMLNALMLSINTFTTLGFGEIPIKGLPRYLAIVQGFIGWFMLTIFSVSLISQLLN
tara:strand:+ start:3909 stop:5768 length:1860 start_codon:yes stop_codon:yes gene_type:complete